MTDKNKGVMAVNKMSFAVVLFSSAIVSTFAQTTWNSATDGAWTNDAAWTAGVPNANVARCFSFSEWK
jgi:hypothetical protein